MRYTITFALASLLALTAPARAEAPLVVTDIPAVHALVAAVMGDRGAPVLLLTPGADPHDMALRPSQARQVSDAALAVWMGPAMSPWLERALDGTGSGARSLDLLAVEGTHLLPAPQAREGQEDHDDHAAQGEGHDHDPAEETHASEDGHADAAHDHAGEKAATDADDHADEHGHEAAAHDHDHGPQDPHAWLDPDNARHWLPLIAAALAEADPAGADAYRANADATGTAIEILDTRLQAMLAPLAGKPFLTTHDALGYFTAHYGLTPAGALAAGDAAPPSAARLRRIETSIPAGACIFPEANRPDTQARQMAEAAGLRLGPPLDPEGLALPPGPGLYPALLEGLAQALAACLSG